MEDTKTIKVITSVSEEIIEVKLISSKRNIKIEQH